MTIGGQRNAGGDYILHSSHTSHTVQPYTIPFSTQYSILLYYIDHTVIDNQGMPMMGMKGM